MEPNQNNEELKQLMETLMTQLKEANAKFTKFEKILSDPKGPLALFKGFFR